MLRKFIIDRIETKSSLLTDSWKEYTEISLKGYFHDSKEETMMLDGEKILPNVYRIALLPKDGFRKSPKLFWNYKYMILFG